MDRQPAGLDFALLGHQDSWDRVMAFVGAVREPGLEKLPLEKVRDIFSWIPPRVSFHIEATSCLNRRTVRGAYVETFIPPDKLSLSSLGGQLQRVKEAADVTRRIKARIVGLGGFTSIILEGQTSLIGNEGDTVFTTGNTLTAVYVAKGVERACAYHNMPLAEARLLVIGASGDIGSACVRYFRGKCREILLHARRLGPLETMRQELESQGQACRASTDLNTLLSNADVIIAAASTAAAFFDPSECQTHAIVCDAGYPKNFLGTDSKNMDRLFFGGMGQMLGGYVFEPADAQAFYQYPFENIGHGCLFEAMLLAMENRFESYSSGRGGITVENMEHLWEIAEKHGLTVAPLFNARGSWQPLKNT